MRGKIASIGALTAALFLFGSVPAQASQQTGTVYAYAIAANTSSALIMNASSEPLFRPAPRTLCDRFRQMRPTKMH